MPGMTNETMAPAVPTNQPQATKILTGAAVAQLAANLDPEAAMLAGADKDFKALSTAEAQVEAVAQQAASFKQGAQTKAVRDLTEDDAYNLEVSLAAGAMFSPNFLRIKLKDGNNIARWANRNNVRQAGLVAQGFKIITKDDVENFDDLSMFLDSQGHFVYSDLVAMKIPRNIYYGRIRHAYIKSLVATNNREAKKAGADFAKGNLTSQLSAGERSYLANLGKDVYNPQMGV